MRKTWIRPVALAAATAFLAVSVCGCSLVKKLYGDKDAAVADNGGAAVEYADGNARDLARTPLETEAEVSVAMSGGLPAASEEDKLAEYKDYGISYDPATAQWWLGEKPVAAFYDPGHHTMTNGFLVDVGAFVLVERGAAGGIEKLSDVGKDGIERAAGITVDSSLEQTAKAQGRRFYQEDVTVKGMSRAELIALERQLHAKYRHQDAVVQLNDFVMFLDIDELLKMSSFCASDNNAYGVSVSADYDVADEMDLKQLDSAAVDKALLELLSGKVYEDKAQVEAAAKTVVAEFYGISGENLVAVAGLI